MSEFNEFKPRLKSPENRFQLSAGLNHEKLNTILSGTNHIWAVDSRIGFIYILSDVVEQLLNLFYCYLA